jgi:two-component sensor histidine kinase
MSLSTADINEFNREQVNRILEVVMSYAQLDFSQKTEVLGNNEILDAISAGINMLGEELENSTVSLKEKEQLLKEVHHRVKNNMQIVSSLLNLQSENILDEKYLALIKDSRNRITSMAIVHEMLYASKDLSRIEISEYIQRLCQSVHQSFFRPGFNIQMHYSIEQNLYFDIDHMIPIGLIINEIISNSFKYAFPENEGKISVLLNRDDKACHLCIEDNGIGLSEDFNFETDGHLGMQLIQMLTQQLEAYIRIERSQGTSYHITFKN